MNYRHGDVLLDKVNDSAKGLQRVKLSARGIVLAEGEATGHAHRIDGGAAVLYELPGNDNAVRLLVVRRTVNLVHEEHGRIELPPGKYRVRIKRAYSPDGWTRVVD